MAAGVRQGQRRVPPLESQAMRPAAKPAGAKDEVAAILNGLQLDKQFFLGKMQKELLEGLMPPPPMTPVGGGDAPGDSDASPQHHWPSDDMSPEGCRRRLQRNKSIKQSVARARASSVIGCSKKKEDFDIYLNEALLPVLAQSLDSLCRQLNRMDEQGDALDPKVRARFNPLTWLAQQLLRRHPKCARTPRRQAIYRDFKDWSDMERGRREMLRRRDLVHHVFSGFMLRGAVQRGTVPKVINAIDDTLKLAGVLKGNSEVQRQFGPSACEAVTDKGRFVRRKSKWFQGDAWSFGHFWYQFANLLIQHDIVPYSAIERGFALQQKEAQALAAQEEAQQREAEARRQRDADQRRQMAEYAELHEQLRANEQLAEVLEQGKILTGDDVRPGDAGYQFELPPKGQHVVLLASLLGLLGFSIPSKSARRHKASKDPSAAPEATADEEWWTTELADAWAVLQEIHFAELADGVVEKEVLQKVLVPPVGFMLLKHKVEDELERRAEDTGGDPTSKVPRDPSAAALAAGSAGRAKPSMEALCQRLNTSMERMTWLHQLFESFLQADEDAAEGEARAHCGYPESPASIKKQNMRALMAEVRPDLGEAEFEARFRRIDGDANGMIEFDEFVTWVRDDEITVVGSESQKMSFHELALAYEEPEEVIRYLHTCFQDQLPEGQVDGYPGQPVGLSKPEVRSLLQILSSECSEEDFEANWDIVDVHQKGAVDFDEFLEFVDFAELPADVRDRYS